ncbi:flagellar FliJ protein [Permianibacter aggregans]|uniref:Flagellar FliJ protein n=2 Tax=Permianibacter aggregans TaxID=1510150 RepID=A0A4R6USF5_9GAMM|nr:flagellar FliJ protein [Permianibacter aggregans]
MNRSERMAPIAKMAGQQKQQAARQLGDARASVAAENKRLEELIQYKQEYLADFQRRGRAGLAGLALQQFQSFITQLDRAIAQQRDRLKGAEQHVSRQVHHYRQRSGKAIALDNAVEQMKKNESAARDKREQASTDELSARQSTLKRQG